MVLIIFPRKPLKVVGYSQNGNGELDVQQIE